MGRRRKWTNFGACILTLLAVKLWLVGCAMIGYMAWVLATTVTVRQFLSGTLIFTYVVVAIGFMLFLTGLLGWVGASSCSPCILRMYIMAVVLSITFEVGGVLTLSILRVDMSDIIENGWGQVNQVTRNAIQNHFNCCGYTGPKEFAYQDDLLDETCYEISSIPKNGTMLQANVSTDAPIGDNHVLKMHGCGRKLQKWFEDNKVIWVSIMAGIGLLQVFGVLTAIFVTSRIQRKRQEEIVDEMEKHSRAYSS